MTSIFSIIYLVLMHMWHYLYIRYTVWVHVSFHVPEKCFKIETLTFLKCLSGFGFFAERLYVCLMQRERERERERDILLREGLSRNDNKPPPPSPLLSPHPLPLLSPHSLLSPYPPLLILLSSSFSLLSNSPSVSRQIPNSWRDNSKRYVLACCVFKLLR